MTTASAKNPLQRGQLGTISVLAWTGDPEAGHNTPYLIAYSLGDGPDGAEAGEQAVLTLIEEVGLAVGGQMADLTKSSASRITLLVEGGQAVLNMPQLSAQCPVPPEWLAAVQERGHAHFIIASRPWPEAVPGEPVTEEELQAFLGDQETLLSSAHVLVAVSQLRR
ncbi:DUF5949 family protein [Streptomyces sp. NPDC051907]|uniref:DUF5949 family protein n=1 Tax=Streptomyces sp. NPDC051907 TaxID=3155284 RepID=UPI00344909E3